MPTRLPAPELGVKFNHWEFLEVVSTGWWKCRCICGLVSRLKASHVKGSKSKSCGCMATRGARKHGRSAGSKAYSTWKNMKQRCLNPNNDHYSRYGGRGITIDEAFVNSFEAFLLEVGEPTSSDLSLDRVDNNLGYVKGNLRWATVAEQNSNKGNHRFLTHRGETRTLTAWANLTGMSKKVLRARLDVLGWTVQEALEVPVRADIRTYSKL